MTMRITIIYRLDDNDSQSTATSQIGLYPWPAAMKAPLPLSGFGRNESLVLQLAQRAETNAFLPRGKGGKILQLNRVNRAEITLCTTKRIYYIISHNSKRKTCMSHQDPSNVPLASYLWVVGLSILSGAAGYLSRFLSDKPVKRPILTLIMDVSYSLLAGLTTYFMGQASELPEMTTIVFVCIGSHMGAKLLLSMQRLVQKQIKLAIPAEEES